MKHLVNEQGDVILKKVQPVVTSLDGVDLSLYETAVILDVETTGLDSKKDEVIQISLLPIWIDVANASVVAQKAPMTRLQQPATPISTEIQQLTGITNDDVEGHAIDWRKVAAFLSRCKWVIAHNAQFDYRFVAAALEAAGLSMPDTNWCCSMSHTTYEGLEQQRTSLQFLAHWHGLWYEAHDAKNDVQALLAILKKNPLAFKQALTRSANPDWRVYAAGSLFEENTLLKARAYKWDSEARCWWLSVDSEVEAEEEKVWLENNLEKVEPQVVKIDPAQRFK